MLTNPLRTCLRFSCTKTYLRWPFYLLTLVFGLMLIRDATAFMAGLEAKLTESRQVAAELTRGDRDTPEAILHQKQHVGLRIFVNGRRSQCKRCHNGPLLTHHAAKDLPPGG